MAVSYRNLERHRPRCDLANLALDSAGDLGVAAQVVLRVLASLAEPGVAIGEEGAALADDVEVGGDVEDASLTGNSLVVHDVELGGSEGRRDLVLHDAHACTVADNVCSLLDRVNTADVEANGGVEL